MAKDIELTTVLKLKVGLGLTFVLKRYIEYKTSYTSLPGGVICAEVCIKIQI